MHGGERVIRSHQVSLWRTIYFKLHSIYKNIIAAVIKCKWSFCKIYFLHFVWNFEHSHSVWGKRILVLLPIEAGFRAYILKHFWHVFFYSNGMGWKRDYIMIRLDEQNCIIELAEYWFLFWVLHLYSMIIREIFGWIP